MAIDLEEMPLLRVKPLDLWAIAFKPLNQLLKVPVRERVKTLIHVFTRYKGTSLFSSEIDPFFIYSSN